MNDPNRNLTPKELLARIERLEMFLVKDSPNWIRPEDNIDTILSEDGSLVDEVQSIISQHVHIEQVTLKLTTTNEESY
jgi:hypothetical protein